MITKTRNPGAGNTGAAELNAFGRAFEQRLLTPFEPENLAVAYVAARYSLSRALANEICRMADLGERHPS